MPPEPYPWDRRDFRKHERSGSDPRFGGGFGGGGPPRRRDQQHHNAPSSHPPSYHQNHHHQQQQRWYSDFRTRSLPPAHGKQASWHTHPDEGGHAFLPFGSRFNDRNIEEENFQSYRSCSDAGRYLRNSRENRVSFSQKDWKATSWEPFAASTPGRPNTETNDQRFVENNKTSHESNCVTDSPKSENLSQPSDSLNPLEPSCPLEKEQQAKDGGNSDGLFANELESSGKLETENCLASIDWKPLKWSRSGSLSSRGSSLSCSSSSKSMGVDSFETVTEVREKKMAPVQSPTSEAAAFVMAAAPASSEETSSRKKPRLGWGEGLAKYEKKKVDSPEDGAARLAISLSNIEETVQSHDMNLLDKSPRVAGFLDLASPATPSSVGCSSSTGIEEKESDRAVIVDHDTANLSRLPSIVSQTPNEGPIFNLENLELTSFDTISSLICDLLQSDDLSSRDSNYLGANSLNKLLLWKVDALKALEITETKIDSLETELKSLIPGPGDSCPHPDSSSLQPQKCHLKPCKEQGMASNFIHRSTPMHLVSSRDMIVENSSGGDEDKHVRLKSENFDSPSSATSKYIEVTPSGEDVYPSQTTQGFMNLDVKNPSNLNEKYVGDDLRDKENVGHAGFCEVIRLNSCNDFARVMDDDAWDIYDSILASNRAYASGASEVLNKLLPSKKCLAGSKDSCLHSIPSSIKKKYFMRKQFIRFKEKVLTIKYKLFQHFWIEGQLVSLRKLQAKSHKKLDLVGHNKHRYGRSRICSLADSSRTVPAEDVVDFVSGLLSESSFKPCRNALKMPALILDKKEMQMSRFITSNGMVEDPCAVEKERSMINAWTPAEREIFIDKLATFGKDFRSIVSFLDHKTIADCVEFYYKNHKSDSFEKARKKPEAVKQCKSQSTTYLVTSGKRWNREAVAASLDILGEASAIAANADGMENQKGTSRFSLGASSSYKAPRCYDDQSQRSNSLDFYRNEREAVAADVLAGICGSLSSEAVSSCITSSFDPGDGYQDSRCQRVGFSTKRSLNPEITQIVDDECSDESCGEMDPTDWTDMEKSIFIQAVSSYGKDFGMISRCVRTRSRDQCKVFFSKSRKCLGLDLILPGFHNAVFCDVYGGGSDIEDASVVETGSLIFNEGSGVKTEEDLPSPDRKSIRASTVMSGTPSLKPDSKRCEELNGLNSHDPNDAKLGVNSLLLDNPQVDDRPVSCVNGQSGATDIPVSVKEIGVMGVSSVAESLRGVEEANDQDLPNGSTVPEKTTLIEISENQGKDKEVSDLLLAEDKSADQNVEVKDADSTEVSGTYWIVTQMKSESQHIESTSCPSGDGHFSMQVDNLSGCQKKADLRSTTVDTSNVRALPQNSHIASLRPSTLFSVPIKYQILTLPSVGINGANNDHSQDIVQTCDCQRHISGQSLSDPVESSQILRGYPVSVPMMNEEVNGCVGCQKTVLHQNASRPDGNLHTGRSAEPLLQKCNGSGRHAKIFDAAHPVHDQTDDHSRPQPSCSSGFEKPSGNGDVKLFGKILVPSQQKQDSCGQLTDDNGQSHKSSSSFLGLKFNNEQNFSFDSSVSKLDRHNYLGSDNIQARNFSFWDGNRMKTGLPPIADSTLLLSKYPAAFSNYTIPAVKIEHPPLHGVVAGNDRPLKGVSLYQTKDLCSSNGIADYLKNEEGQQPFTINMKSPQATLFPEMQRQNGFHIVPGMQQQSRGLVEMNIGRGGVIVGGQCTTVSDPVAAIKLHYAKTEQFSLQARNIIKDDDTWRSKGDVGR